MPQIKVKSFVFELFGGKMRLTVMNLDTSNHRHLEQIFISLELSRYQGSTAFTPGILDKAKLKKAYIDNRHRKHD